MVVEILFLSQLKVFLASFTSEAQPLENQKMSSTPTERKLAAQIAAHESWANTSDRSKRTAPARAALMAKFELQADPEGKLLPAERAKRAEHLRKAHFKRLALASAKSRRTAKSVKAVAAKSEAELCALGGDAA